MAEDAMNKITRNLDTPESREFWSKAEEAAAEVATWPDWKRAGINVSQTREVLVAEDAIENEIKEAVRAKILEALEKRILGMSRSAQVDYWDGYADAVDCLIGIVKEMKL